MKELFPVLFGVLFCSVFVWFALCVKLFKMLETRHPVKFNAMGRPSLVMNNNLSNNISFMRFLLKREYVELNDPVVSRLSSVMLVYLIVYLIGFMILFFSVPLGYAV